MRLTHPRLRGFVAAVTAVEINFSGDVTKLFCPLVLFNVTLHTCSHKTIHSGTAGQTQRDVKMADCFMLASNTVYTE